MKKSSFPLFTTHPNICYLDSAATSLKPHCVIDAMHDYYTTYTANIHRGLYPLSIYASEQYDKARQIVAEFIHADQDEIVFTKGATEGLNLLASSLDRLLPPDAKVTTTILEHHSNFVPWQIFSQKRGHKLDIIYPEKDMTIPDLVRTRLPASAAILALPAISNVTGEFLPVKEIIASARTVNPSIICIVDASQAVAHMPVDVRDIDADFLVCSGHKLYGPTGIGVLYGKRDRLAKLPPYQYGGDMIQNVTIDTTTFAQAPAKFEAGTPPIAEAIGLGAAIQFIQDVGFDSIERHDQEMREYARGQLSQVTGPVHIVEPLFGGSMTSVISFTHPHVHAHDLADLLGQEGVCIRAGHHCAQPLHTYLKLPATSRISFGVYTTKKDIDIFIKKLIAICTSFI
jgi:cysteine desulfurase/selenocysteine lyase